jgi:dTDP-4-dehydrorhamnose 3,5-epimerase
MKFERTTLPGVMLVVPEASADARGAFAQTFNRAAFESHGLAGAFALSAISTNARAGTLRGLHFQAAPRAEAKLVSCLRGAAYDVVLDLRRRSPTCGRWTAIHISAANGLQLYLPEGCAHGFQTLADDTVLHYQITADYVPALARGVRWDDPELAIAWPFATPTAISERDRALPRLADALAEAPRALAAV